MAVGNHMLSVIVPVFNEETNLEWHHKKIKQHFRGSAYTYELIYVDDGSTDESLRVIKKLAKDDKQTKFISFSRNFGKEAATTAGLRAASGEAAVIIDADGQHPVEVISQFIEEWKKGYQVVIGVRKSNTDEGLAKRYGSLIFYKVLNALSNNETIPQSTDFRLLDRRVIDEFNSLTEHNRITRGLIDWLGFKRTTVEFEALARHSGKAAYSVRKLIKLALYAFVSQTTRPLRFTGYLGFAVMVASALIGLGLLIEKYALGDPLHYAVTGTAILGIFVSFLVGLVLLSNWFLALYIESIHSETQNRPLYIVAEESE